jgi:amino acid transporter
LEQAFPKPAFLFATAYAFFTVAFSFSSSNAVVLARYIYRAAGYSAGEWANKGLALAAYTFLAFICLVSNKWSLRLMNLISAVKLIILVFIAITGFVVLGGGTHIKDPHANFRNSFDGITSNANDIVNALVSINFSYTGYANAFNVVAEIKVSSLFSLSITSDSNDVIEPNSHPQARGTFVTPYCLHPLHSRQRRLLRSGSRRRDP